MWGEGGGVFVVGGREGVGGPVLEEHVSSTGPEGLVSFSHAPGGGGCWSRADGEREGREGGV